MPSAGRSVCAVRSSRIVVRSMCAVTVAGPAQDGCGPSPVVPSAAAICSMAAASAGLTLWPSSRCAAATLFARVRAGCAVGAGSSPGVMSRCPREEADSHDGNVTLSQDRDRAGDPFAANAPLVTQASAPGHHFTTSTQLNLRQFATQYDQPFGHLIALPDMCRQVREPSHAGERAGARPHAAAARKGVLASGDTFDRSWHRI